MQESCNCSKRTNETDKEKHFFEEVVSALDIPHHLSSIEPDHCPGVNKQRVPLSSCLCPRTKNAESMDLNHWLRIKEKKNKKRKKKRKKKIKKRGEGEKKKKKKKKKTSAQTRRVALFIKHFHNHVFNLAVLLREPLYPMRLQISPEPCPLWLLSKGKVCYSREQSMSVRQRTIANIDFISKKRVLLFKSSGLKKMNAGTS